MILADTRLNYRRARARDGPAVLLPHTSGQVNQYGAFASVLRPGGAIQRAGRSNYQFLLRAIRYRRCDVDRIKKLLG